MSREDLEALAMWTFLDKLGFVLVIVGVAGEGAELLLKFFAWCRKKNPSKSARRRAKITEHVFWSVLVFGLGLEFFAQHQSEVITERERLRVTKLASELHGRATLTESNNLVLRSTVVALELELEQIKAPRTITKGQRERFISAAKDQPKGAVKVGVRNADIETFGYLEDVVNLITNAGYEVSSAINYSDQITGRLNDNSTIMIAFESIPSAPAHGRGLLRAFNESGISVALSYNSDLPFKMPVGSNEVLVWVLEKRPTRPTQKR